jgi:two-component system, sensor histidine kinase PdtaS
VRLRFQDDGRGLPPGFDFQSAESLGLRLIRMLSKQLRGELKVHNGSGSTFELSFHIRDPHIDSSSEAKVVLDGQG